MIPVTVDAPPPDVALRRLLARYVVELPDLRAALAEARVDYVRARDDRLAARATGDRKAIARAADVENRARGRTVALRADVVGCAAAVETLVGMTAEVDHADL